MVGKMRKDFIMANDEQIVIYCNGETYVMDKSLLYEPFPEEQHEANKIEKSTDTRVESRTPLLATNGADRSKESEINTRQM